MPAPVADVWAGIGLCKLIGQILRSQCVIYRYLGLYIHVQYQYCVSRMSIKYSKAMKWMYTVKGGGGVGEHNRSEI